MPGGSMPRRTATRLMSRQMTRRAAAEAASAYSARSNDSSEHAQHVIAAETAACHSTHGGSQDSAVAMIHGVWHAWMCDRCG